MDYVTLDLDAVNDLTENCLSANGCNQDNAVAISKTVAAAERDGCASHGLFRLPGYVASLRSGKVKGDALPQLEQIAPSVLRVDGDGGFAPLALEHGRQPLIDLARNQGVAIMALVKTYHFAALWFEVEPLAAAGLFAMACTASTPMVTPAGGSKPLYGTNPIAFGWPRKDQAPMIADMATSTMARGEVMIAARDGHELPPGVGLDAAGRPTTDPNEVLKGVLLPFGGYKGSAVAMLVELLAAGLIGDRFSFEAGEHDNKDGGPPRGGEFLLAIDPSRCGNGTGWLNHTEGFFEKMLSMDGVRLPGNRRHVNREQTAQQGVRIPKKLFDQITALTTHD